MPAAAQVHPYGADLSSPDTFVEGVPHETFRRLRAEAPVFWHPDTSPPRAAELARAGRGFWVLTKHADVWKVSLDAKTFSSERGTALLPEFTEEEMVPQRELMLNMDPPRHTKHRRLVNMGFSPKVLNQAEIAIRSRAKAIVDAVARRGTCDFVTEVAAELPLQVIVEMLGVPHEDRHKFFEWSNTMVGAEDPEYATSPEVGQMAMMQLFAYANELAVDRKACPREDLTTLLLQAQVDGEHLTESQYDSFVMLLSVAGNETTRNLISGGMLALFDHPEQRARLQRDPSLLPTAVEEMLRWVSPVMAFRRTAQKDTEVRGVRIREGDRVWIWYASANRDEEVFPDADVFDVGRTPNDHLGFGIGPHFCLGSHLARMEIRIMFEEVLRRLPDIQLDGEVQRLRSNFINGVKHIPVRFTPER
ncbi:MAG: cytochrome P450 [bacterium]|nr:cytochrome P450 [bacterium]